MRGVGGVQWRAETTWMPASFKVIQVSFSRQMPMENAVSDHIFQYT